MKKKIIFLSLLTGAFIFASCGGSSSNKTNTSTDTEETEISYSEESDSGDSSYINDATFRYEIIDSDSKDCRILGFKDGFDYNNYKDLTLPEEVNGYRVLDVDSNAFSYTYIEKLTIPSSCGSIGNDAFAYCLNLKEVIIEDGITYIGEYAFNHCDNLVSVKLPNSIDSISSNTFYECKSLTEIVIPDNIENIGYDAFGSCYSLYRITLGKNVNYIDSNAFEYCYKLLEVYNLSDIDLSDGNFFENNVTEHKSLDDESIIEDINGSKFINLDDTKYLIAGVVENKTLKLPNNFNYNIFKYAFYDTDIENVTIPSCVNTISDSAFRYSKIRNVTLENGIKYIESSAFADCYRLYTITLPQSLEIISSTTFESCYSLVEIYKLTSFDLNLFLNPYVIHNDITDKSIINVDSNVVYAVKDNEAYVIGYTSNDIVIKDKVTINDNKYDVKYIKDHAFYNSDLTSVALSDSIIEIGDNAFAYSKELKSINFGNGVEKIYDYAFLCCQELEEIALPNSVDTLGENCFFNCYGLEKATLSNKLETIPYGCFQACYNLNEILLPESVKNIGYDAFFSTAIKSINIPKNVVSIDDTAFADCDYLKTITVDSANKNFDTGLNNNYLIDKNTSVLIIICDGVEIPDNVILGKYSMSLYSEEEVILPKVLLGIRDEAFYSSGVYTVRFSGTKAEFDEIVTSSWAAYSNVNKLICKDGTFYLNEE